MKLKKVPHHPMWEKPVHHEDAIQKTHQVHWIELFYDLIHVVAIFLLGTYLTDHLSVMGFVHFTLMFVSLWVAWGDYVFYNSLYVSRDYRHRIASSFHIVTVMVMAASIPSIESGGLFYFMLAYGVNRIMTAYFYRRARRYNRLSQTLASEMFRNFLFVGVLMVGAAFLSHPWNLVVFAFGIVAIQMSYLLPKYGVMRFSDFTPRLEHLSERFSLLLLICLGEGYFKMVLALADKGIEQASGYLILNYLLGGIALFLLAWMYFDFVGNEVVKDEKKKTMAYWWYGHLSLMFFALMIGVALKGQVKVSFDEPYPLAFGILGSLGFIGYILSLEAIQHTLKNRLAHHFANFQIKLFGIFLVVLALFMTYQGFPSWIANITFGAAMISQLLWPITRGYFRLKPEIQAMHAHREKTLKPFEPDPCDLWRFKSKK